MGNVATTAHTAPIKCLSKLDEAIQLLGFMKELINKPSDADDTPLAFLEASQDVRQMLDSAVHIALQPALAGRA